MAFIGNTPTAVPLTGSQIADGTIINANIATNTINLTQKVTSALAATNGGTGTSSYTAGNILYASNATTLAALAPGTSGYVLSLNGTTPAWTAVSSDYVLLATTDASSSASVSFDGYFSSTYKNYKVIFSNIIPSSNGNEAFRLRYRRSNADITASNYRGIGSWTSMTTASGQTNSTSGFNNTDYANVTTASTTTSGYGLSGDVIIYDPLNTTQFKVFIGQAFTSDPSQELVHFKPAGRLVDSQNALSGLTFYFASGNIASGNFKLYGIK